MGPESSLRGNLPLICTIIQFRRGKRGAWNFVRKRAFGVGVGGSFDAGFLYSTDRDSVHLV